MAQVIIEDFQFVGRSWVWWIRTALIGVAIGLTFWILTTLIGHYVIEPLACKQVSSAATCINANSLAGNIATILVAVIAIVGMVRMRIARPIVIAVASAAVLWDLAAWTQGLFWLEAIGWSVLLYGVVFGLFAWITRYATLWVTLVLSLVVVLIVRIGFAL